MFLRLWKDHMEGGTFTRRCLRIDIATVVLCDFPAHGQPDACTLVFIAGVKTLKDVEDLSRIFLAEADTVVFERYLVIGLSRLQRLVVSYLHAIEFGEGNGYLRTLLPGAELERIGNEISEQLDYLHGTAIDCR